MKKILVISNSAWSIKNYRLPLIKDFMDRGFDIVAVAPWDESVTVLEQNHINYRDIKINRKGNNIIEDIRLIWNLYKIYKEEKPDLVIHFTIKPVIYGTLASIFLKTKVINNITGLGYIFIGNSLVHKILRPIVKILYRFSLRHSFRIFFQNEDDRNLFYDMKLIKRTDEFTEILPGSGVDTKVFKRSTNDKNTRNENIKFLYVGRILWDKGLGELYDASKKLKAEFPDVEIILLGNFDYENPAYISKEQIETWKVNDIINHIDYVDDVRPYLEDADVFVLPSYREGTPRSTLEAMAYELPVITTDVPGCRRTVINSENGYLVKVKDVDTLFDAMKDIIQNKEKRLIMGRKSRQFAEQYFDINIVNQYYFDAIDNINDI